MRESTGWGIQKLIAHGKIIKALKKNSFGTTTPFEGQDRRSTMNENHSDKYVGIMVFGPASPFKRSRRIKAHKRLEYPHTNMDIDHGLKSGLWAIRSQQRPPGFIAQTRHLLASCTPSSSQLMSLRRCPTNDFSVDLLQLKNISSYKPYT